MLTEFSIEAVIAQSQPLDWLSADDVRIDDLVHVGFSDMAVPDCIRINDNVRAVLALIQTAGLIGSHSTL